MDLPRGRLAQAAGPCFIPCHTEHFHSQVLWPTEPLASGSKRPLEVIPDGGPKEAETFLRVYPFPTGSSPGTLEDLVLSVPTLGERLELCRFQNRTAAFRSRCVVPECVHERVNRPCVHSVSIQPIGGAGGGQHPWSVSGLLGVLGKGEEEGLWLLGAVFIT